MSPVHLCILLLSLSLGLFGGVLSSSFVAYTPPADRAPVDPSSPGLPPPHAHFLVPYVLPPPAVDGGSTLFHAPPRGSRVLVLGAAGLVGRGTTKWLRQEGYEVVEIRNRAHFDLRTPGILDQPRFSNISFVMFLACEVGGSKFLSSKQAQIEILAHNIRIYDVVFEWIARQRIPFLFTSTSLVSEPDAYGTMKRLGEAWVAAMPYGMGRIVRLWNIYGVESITHKSHVMADWAHACITKGEVQSMTAGNEARMFIHMDDCGAGLGSIMQHFEHADFVTDLGHDQWVTMQEVGSLFSQVMIEEAAAAAAAAASQGETEVPLPMLIGKLGTCQVSYSKNQATPRALLQPKLDVEFQKWWHPRINMKEGIRELLKHYHHELIVKPKQASGTAAPAASAGISAEPTQHVYAQKSKDEL